MWWPSLFISVIMKHIFEKQEQHSLFMFVFFFVFVFEKQIKHLVLEQDYNGTEAAIPNYLIVIKNHLYKNPAVCYVFSLRFIYMSVNELFDLSHRHGDTFLLCDVLIHFIDS